MFAAIKSGRDRLTEQRYLLQSKRFHSWWPWGSLRFVVLVLLYLYGATLAAPQAAAEVRRDFLDWLNVGEEPQHSNRIEKPSDLRVPAPEAASATGIEAAALGNQEGPGAQTNPQGVAKAQQ